MTVAAGARLRFWCWSAFIAVLLGVFFVQVLPRLKVETDILALLPVEQGDAAANKAVAQFSQALAEKMIFLVGAPQSADAKNAAARFAAALRASNGFSQIELEVSGRTAEQLKLYQAHRGVLISNRQFVLLKSGQDAAVLQETLRAAFTPAGLARPIGLAEDPLGLATNYLQQQVPSLGAAQLDGSVLTITDGARSYVLIMAELAGSPFASVTQEAAMSAIAAAREKMGVDEELLISGTVQHADAATRRAQNELATFGAIETIAVMALLLAVFGALRPLGLGAITLGLAFAAGIAATHFVFGVVHVLALVFGSSLIGGVIDYSIHFFADRFRKPANWTPADAYEHVGGAILLGLTTTLLGYAVLLLVPFPGLRQIALFCIAGLIVGCGTVLCWYPVFYKAPQKTSVLGQRAGHYLAMKFANAPVDGMRIAVAAVALLALLAGLFRIQLQDDVRALQSSPAPLLAMEQRVAALLSTGVESRYFLVRAPDEQALLETEEQLAAALDSLIAQGQLSVYTTVTRSLPSYRQQRAAQSLLQEKAWGEQGLQARAWAALGFSKESISTRSRNTPGRDAWLSPEEWLASPASESYRPLWLGRVDTQYAGIVTLGGIKDVAALNVIAAQISDANSENARVDSEEVRTDSESARAERSRSVRLIDRIAAVTRVLQSYREAMTWLLLIVYLVAGAALAQKFGWRETPGLLLPSALASLATLGMFGWFGVPVNLFTLLALWLVLGLGVDYGIFLRHGRTALGTAVLSVTLSATTTLLAFGLLAFSATPFIRSIGLTLLCSITLSWLFAMLNCVTLGMRRQND